MINDLNRVTVMGHIGADAKQNADNAPVIFSIATSSHWNDNAGDRQSRTEWHNVVVFGNLRKYALQLRRGDRVYVEGELRVNRYEKTVGNEIVKFRDVEINASEIDRIAAKAEVAAKAEEFTKIEEEIKPVVEAKTEGTRKKK